MALIDPKTSSDEVLLQRAAKGDKQAFGMLYERYLILIYRYCYFRVADQHEAEDLTEVTFLKAWEGLFQNKGAREIRSFRAWIYRIAHNAIIDHIRTKKPIEGDIHENLAENSAPGLEHMFQSREDGENIAQAVQQLDPIYQQVIVMRFVNQLSHAETAQILGVTENHVRILQFRGLKKLSEILRKEQS
jgi:RNA polymerase sigma-70 factor (ECF subfamily)